MTSNYGMPHGGGWDDQEAGRLERAMIAGNAYNALKSFRGIKPGTGAEWQRNNPDKWEIIQDIMGLTDGGVQR